MAAQSGSQRLTYAQQDHNPKLVDAVEAAIRAAIINAYNKK